METKVSKEVLLDFYRKMNCIRAFENEAIELAKMNLTRAAVHTYNGEEAIAVGVCAHLTNHDYITSTHRGHGHCVAKGADLERMFAELMARENGYCKGKGGSMHIADLSIGMLGANGIVGGGIPIAVGAAFALKYQERSDVVVCFFGDGASNEGSFHESLNMASVLMLPVIFVCENNQYAISMNVKDSVNVQHQPAEHGLRHSRLHPGRQRHRAGVHGVRKDRCGRPAGQGSRPCGNEDLSPGRSLLRRQ